MLSAQAFALQPALFGLYVPLLVFCSCTLHDCCHGQHFVLCFARSNGECNAGVRE